MDARIVDGRKIARVTDDGKLEVLVHGRDGDNLVPVKVSEDGYLMLATDVTVDLGTVELSQGAPGQNPWPVTLSGTIVTIGEDTFQLSGGDTLRGLAADKPAAADAHAAIPFCFYLSVDTGTVEVTTGTDWVVI